MFNGLLVLALLAKMNGGAGLSKLHEMAQDEGYGISRYKVRASLNELKSIGAVMRKGNVWYLTLFGANLTVAEQAAAQGYNCGFSETDHYMPVYQKGGF